MHEVVLPVTKFYDSGIQIAWWIKALPWANHRHQGLFPACLASPDPAPPLKHWDWVWWRGTVIPALGGG